MSYRSDYIKVLEIFLKFQKVDGKRLVRISEFMEKFDSIFIANEDAVEILLEMEHLDLIREDHSCDHILGEDGMEMLEKGWEILKSHRKMDL